MPTAVTETPYRPVPVEPARRHWTRAECEALKTIGLPDYQKLELIDGELISKMGKNRPHINALIFIQAWLIRVFGWEFINPETPIDVT